MSEQHFHFNDGNSNKFWKIRLDGDSFTVHFGRVGTAGQIQTKKFATDAEAEKEHNKLIAEKVKKGYSKTNDADSIPASVEPKAAIAKPPATIAAQAKPPSESTLTPTVVPNIPHPVPAQPQSPSNTVVQFATANTVVTNAAQGEEAEHFSSPSAVATLEPPLPAAPQSTNEHHSPKYEILFSEEEWQLSKPAISDIPRAKPATQQFDLARCIQILLGLAKGPEMWATAWTVLSINPLQWSLEESHFWLAACSMAQTMAYTKMDKFRRVAAFEGTDPQELTTKLQRMQYRSDLSADEVEQTIKGTRGRAEHFSWVSYPLVRLVSPIQYVTIWHHNLSKLNRPMFDAFNNFIVPYLSRTECEALEQWARTSMDQEPWLTTEASVPVSYLVASTLGMQTELLDTVKKWPDKHFAGINEYRQDALGFHELVFGLTDPEIMLQQARRLGLKLQSERHFYLWVGRTKFSALDVVHNSIVTNHKRNDLGELLHKVVSPESAKYIFLNFVESHSKEDKKWLDEHPIECLEGLYDLAQQRNASSQAARRYLRDLAHKIEPGSISQSLAEKLKAIDCPIGGVPAASSRSEAPDWLVEALNTVQPEKKKLKLSDWIAGASLEAATVDGWRLTEDQIEKLLIALQQSTAESMHPLITKIREHGDRRQYDAFTWDLFSRWVAAEGPPKDKWAMYSLGLIGSEKSINPLVTMMQAWRESGHHARAQSGLEVLRFFGSDYALMRVHEISQSPRLKSLRSRALEVMEEVAKSRNMTKPELEDRIVPTCGLDETGSRIFDFGPRQFTFFFGPDLKPMLKDEKGGFKTDLPAPNQKDDAEKSKQSVEEWKELKKQLKTVAKIQAKRLEQAMVTGRSWSREEFDNLLLNHPLITNLMRLIVWVAYDKDNKAIKTFRVSEDKKFSDQSDRETSIEGACRMAVIHPLHMSDEEKSKWGEIFTDYEIVSLFPQIGRPVYRLEESEVTVHDITRFKDTFVPAAAIPGTLERLNWLRGPAEDGGVYSWHYKHFYDDNISAVVEYQGIPMAMMQEWDAQKIERCFFVPKIFKNYWDQTQPLPLSRVPATIISEVLYDLNTLTAHGKEDDED